jgi:hypothetical protein
MKYHNTLHIHGQEHSHDDVFIFGDRQALKLLSEAIQKALENDSLEDFNSYVIDGEGFKTFVTVMDDDDDWDERILPYSGKYDVSNENEEFDRSPYLILNKKFPGEYRKRFDK